MTDKSKYYLLDEIGFVGTQEKDPAYEKYIQSKTVAYIKALKKNSSKKKAKVARQ